MSWNILHDAPRDRPIWLFLPSAVYKLDEQRRPYDVQHLTVVGHWDEARVAWVARDDNRAVYPSCWSDAPIDGPAPASPLEV